MTIQIILTNIEKPYVSTTFECEANKIIEALDILTEKMNDPSIEENKKDYESYELIRDNILSGNFSTWTTYKNNNPTKVAYIELPVSEIDFEERYFALVRARRYEN